MITHHVSQTGFGVQDHSSDEIREAINSMELVMRLLPQVTIEPTHVFSKGLYARGILIPKGTILTGKVHRQDDLQVMVSGDILIKTEMGEKRLQGFNMFPSKAGYKQIGRALEDTRWITMHATDETDLDRLEKLLFEDEPKILDFKTGRPLDDCQDYYRMLAEVGIPHETAWAQSINEFDRQDISIPGVILKPSPIHGTGVFAAQRFLAGDVIGMARIDGLRTQLGRYTNHCQIPNAQMVAKMGSIILKAITHISVDDEITTNYRTTLALQGVKCLA